MISLLPLLWTVLLGNFIARVHSNPTRGRVSAFSSPVQGLFPGRNVDRVAVRVCFPLEGEIGIEGRKAVPLGDSTALAVTRAWALALFGFLRGVEGHYVTFGMHPRS